MVGIFLTLFCCTKSSDSTGKKEKPTLFYFRVYSCKWKICCEFCRLKDTASILVNLDVKKIGKALIVLFADRLSGGYYLLGCLLFSGFFFGFFSFGFLGFGAALCSYLFAAFYFLLPSFFQGVFPSSDSLLMNKLG